MNAHASERGRRRRARAAMAAMFALLSAAAAAPPPAAAETHAVVFMYHRFGDGRFPSTNIALDQFDAHIAEIRSGGYNVRPLPEIIAAFRKREPLADRTIAITIDDAYASVYEQAWPRLRQAGLPFTLFIATDAVDRRLAGVMTWDQIRELATAGVTIGSQSASHPHMPDLTQAQNQAEIERSNQRFREELGFTPTLFAYPFGESGLEQQQLIRGAGFVAAFGQHSGVQHADTDLYNLPRFAMNERFGSLDRFRLAANALPLPVSDVTPADTVLRAQNPPAFGFTVDPRIKRLDRLNCYASNQSGAARLERLGPHRIEVRIDEAFAPGRGRINCTLPAGDGRWRWFGVQFFIPKA